MKKRLVVPLHKCIHENNAKCGVVLKKRSQHVGFIPSPPFVDPLLWVLKRIRNVMEVDMDSRRKARQNFKEDAVDITIDLTDMGGIDEQDVVCPKRVKLTSVHVLQSRCKNPYPFLVVLFDKGHEEMRIRFNECGRYRVIKKQLIGIESDT